MDKLLKAQLDQCFTLMMMPLQISVKLVLSLICFASRGLMRLLHCTIIMWFISFRDGSLMPTVTLTVITHLVCKKLSLTSLLLIDCQQLACSVFP